MLVRAILSFLQTYSWLYLIITVVLVWLLPGLTLKLLKYCIVGAFGQFVLGLGSLRWSDQYRNETLPFFKLLGYEFTVRNGDDYKASMIKGVFVNLFIRGKIAFQKKKQIRHQ